MCNHYGIKGQLVAQQHTESLNLTERKGKTLRKHKCSLGNEHHFAPRHFKKIMFGNHTLVLLGRHGQFPGRTGPPVLHTRNELPWPSPPLDKAGDAPQICDNAEMFWGTVYTEMSPMLYTMSKVVRFFH